MRALVDLQSARAGVAAPAVWELAHEGPLARVDQHVRLQVALGDELFLAVHHWAPKRTLSSLNRLGPI